MRMFDVRTMRCLAPGEIFRYSAAFVNGVEYRATRRAATKAVNKMDKRVLCVS